MTKRRLLASDADFRPRTTSGNRLLRELVACPHPHLGELIRYAEDESAGERVDYEAWARTHDVPEALIALTRP